MSLLLEDQEPPTGADPARPAQDPGCRSGGAGVHGRGRAGHGRAPAARGAGARGAGARRCAPAQLGLAGRRPAVVQVLKNYYLPHAGKLSLARIWRGAVKDGTMLGDMRVGGVYRLFGSQQQNVGAAEAGEIVAPGPAGRRPHRRRRSTRRTRPWRCRSRRPAKPMYAFARDRGQPQRRGQAVGRLRQADRRGPGAARRARPRDPPDPAVGPGRDPPARGARPAEEQVQCRGRRRTRRARPTARRSARAPRRTAATRSSRAGTASSATSRSRSARSPRGEGFQFENKVVGGAVPRQFIPAVEAGAREHLQRGPLGFPVVDVAVTLHDGQFHSVDSNELSFKLATAQALKDGLPQLRSGAARADPERHHLGAGGLHRQGAAAGLRQARPDHGLRGQARTGPAGTRSARRSRRARCTT